MLVSQLIACVAAFSLRLLVSYSTLATGDTVAKRSGSVLPGGGFNKRLSLSSLEGLDASEISYASLSEADDDVDPAIIDAVAGNPIPALRPMKKPGGGSLV